MEGLKSISEVVLLLDFRGGVSDVCGERGDCSFLGCDVIKWEEGEEFGVSEEAT